MHSYNTAYKWIITLKKKNFPCQIIIIPMCEQCHKKRQLVLFTLPCRLCVINALVWWEGNEREKYTCTQNVILIPVMKIVCQFIRKHSKATAFTTIRPYVKSASCIKFPLLSCIQLCSCLLLFSKSKKNIY